MRPEGSIPKGPDGKPPFGLYRHSDTHALVCYKKNTMFLPRENYEERGYKPDFDDLPTEAEWEAKINAQRPRGEKRSADVIGNVAPGGAAKRCPYKKRAA